MIRRSLVLASLAALTATAISAPGAGDPQTEEMASLVFQFMKDGKVIENGMTVVGPYAGVAQLGRTLGHVQTRCVSGGIGMESVLLFDGLKVEHRVQDHELVVILTKFDVTDRDDEISALKSGECRELGPTQRVSLERTLRLPTRSESPTVISLENGYAFRYQGLPAMIGRGN